MGRLAEADFSSTFYHIFCIFALSHESLIIVSLSCELWYHWDMLPPLRLVSQGQNRTFDYQLAFDYWIEYGTREKAALAMHRDGITNLEGEPLNPATVRRSAMIWSIEHPKEALEYFHGLDRGYYPDGMDGDDWKGDACRKAMQFIQSRTRLERVLKLNNAYEYFETHYRCQS